MTAVLERLDTPGGATWTIGGPRLLAALNTYDVLDAATHLATHGPMPATDRPRLQALLDSVAITGRGGATLRLATRLRALQARRPQILVDGTEPEPASLKDRVLLGRAPHLVLDGALAVASAVGARAVAVAVRDPLAAAAVRTAAAQRPDGALVRVSVISGDPRRVVQALDGAPAFGLGRRSPPAADGAVVANPETLAQLAVLLRLGPRRFAETGTLAEPGTTLLTLRGAVGRPGVVEIPLGTPLGIVLEAAGAVEPVAVISGGYHGSWLAPVAQLRLSRAGLAAAGGILGAGVLVVVDSRTCALGELARATAWLAGDAPDQCGPCRTGSPALAADLEDLYRGDRAALDSVFDRARALMGCGACGHPAGIARFVTSGLHLLHDETDLHLRSGGCGRPVLGQLRPA